LTKVGLAVLVCGLLVGALALVGRRTSPATEAPGALLARLRTLDSATLDSELAVREALARKGGVVPSAREALDREDAAITDGIAALKGESPGRSGELALAAFLLEFRMALGPFEPLAHFSPRCPDITRDQLLFDLADGVARDDLRLYTGSLARLSQALACVTLSRALHLNAAMTKAYARALARFPGERRVEAQRMLVSALLNAFLLVHDETKHTGRSALQGLLKSERQAIGEAFGRSAMAMRVAGLWLRSGPYLQNHHLCEATSEAGCISGGLLIDALTDPWRLGTGECAATEMITREIDMKVGYRCTLGLCTNEVRSAAMRPTRLTPFGVDKDLLARSECSSGSSGGADMPGGLAPSGLCQIRLLGLSPETKLMKCIHGLIAPGAPSTTDSLVFRNMHCGIDADAPAQPDPDWRPGGFGVGGKYAVRLMAAAQQAVLELKNLNFPNHVYPDVAINRAEDVLHNHRIPLNTDFTGNRACGNVCFNGTSIFVSKSFVEQNQASVVADALFRAAKDIADKIAHFEPFAPPGTDDPNVRCAPDDSTCGGDCSPEAAKAQAFQNCKDAPATPPNGTPPVYDPSPIADPKGSPAELACLSSGGGSIVKTSMSCFALDCGGDSTPVMKDGHCTCSAIEGGGLRTDGCAKFLCADSTPSAGPGGSCVCTGAWSDRLAAANTARSRPPLLFPSLARLRAP
jgi:hypothetical protein